MEDSSHDVSEFDGTKDFKEQEEEKDDEDNDVPNSSVSQGDSLEPDPAVPPNHIKHPSPSDGGWDPLACHACEKHFTTKKGFKQHMYSQDLAKNEMQACQGIKNILSFCSNVGGLQNEKLASLDPGRSAKQLYKFICPNVSTSSPGDQAAQLEKQGANCACTYCHRTFSTYTDKKQHEREFYKQHPPHVREDNQKQQEQNLLIFTEPCQQEGQCVANPAPVLEVEGEQTEQLMLDVSSNISENLSFYIDGKIVSTSTVSTCEAADVHSAPPVLAGLDALFLAPAQMSPVLNTDSVPRGQQGARRRTATPPLLPQIKTELESEMVVSSSSSSTVASTLIENLLPQSGDSTVVQVEKTVFLSPKLKQLLEKQDGLKPTLALITDGLKPCLPVSLSVLPAGTGRFKRRTGSPTSSSQHSPYKEDMTTADSGDVLSTGELETQQEPLKAVQTYDGTQSVEESQVKLETWPHITAGSCCNQQPLDLSSSVRRSEHGSLAEAVLDLSLQKKNFRECDVTINSKEGKSNPCRDTNPRGQNVNQGRGSHFTIVMSSDVVSPVEPSAVYGLAVPPSPASLNPVALQPGSPCTIAFASPASHTVLPLASPLIPVLAPSISDPGQSIQVLGSNISAKPLVICAQNALNSPACDLTSATTSAAKLVALSQPLDPSLGLPGQVFLADQITINPPVAEASPVSEAPFPSNMSLNTVLIECTIALETPGSLVPTALPFRENPAEAPAPAQVVVNHIQQQQFVSVPNHQTMDPPILVSSIEESVTLSTTTSVVYDCPPGHKLSPDPEHFVNTDPPPTTEENAADRCLSKPDVPPESSQPHEKSRKLDESSNEQQQNFTKNFICNVCDKLFHSMKGLGDHVGDHADEWPYKCEFCVLLFDKPGALLNHRSSLHGVGKMYVCSVCTKEFVYLCNMKQHQEELHPGQQCTHTEDEKGKLRPQNYNSLKVSTELSECDAPQDLTKVVKKEGEEDVAAEQVFTSTKIMASGAAKLTGPDIRLGINQHYPSFKPPPFPYHNRSPAASLASATNFTTHNIPQTFSTAIRCTKCGKSFDNMPELHKHILACANASDKRRYTPKKNPIPLRHFAKSQNRVLSSTNSTNGLNASNRATHSNRSKLHQESSVKLKFKVLKKKKKLVHRTMPQRRRSAKVSGQEDGQPEVFVCPHCRREFTMRRSRTKHMAVCPQKPKEVKKRKPVGPSVTKENDGHLHIEETQQAPDQHKTRLHASGAGKRPAILPVQAVFSNKTSKIIIKESLQMKPEAPALSELPVVRTFNPSMRQYTRVQHSTKGLPIKITIGKPQQEEPPLSPNREPAPGPVTCSSENASTA